MIEKRILLGLVFLVLSVCMTGNAWAADNSTIPARTVIAPVQVLTARVDLPLSGRKNVASQLSESTASSIEFALKGNNTFSEISRMPSDALPDSPSIPELAQAGREANADLVLLGKIIEFEGDLEYGFRTAIRERVIFELSNYESETAIRLWHGRQSLEQSKSYPFKKWSNDKIKKTYVELALNELLVNATNELLPRLVKDLDGYKPPAIGIARVAAAEFSSDVDRVPRVSIKTNEDAYAIVIGIEDYRDLPAAEYTSRDARVLREYLIRVMGFPEENIVSLINDRATKSDIEGYLGKWLRNNVDRNSTVFIYYAGHGAPNPATGEAFIIPYDGNPAFPESSGIPLDNIYKIISDLKARNAMIVLDACFSGAGGRSVMARGGRPIAISIESPLLDSNDLIVMSASKGTQISSSYPAKRHGLFTYFFLKGLQGEADINNDRQITTEELYNYIRPQVRKVARKNNREQTPSIFPSLINLGYRANLPITGAVK